MSRPAPALARELPSNESVQRHPPSSCAARQPERSRSGTRERIEPLSAGRYRVQLTADTSFKRKLEQARDLLRHAQPDGELGAIVSRALDCLLEQLLSRRFDVCDCFRAVFPNGFEDFSGRVLERGSQQAAPDAISGRKG